jgi:hypothetical protein
VRLRSPKERGSASILWAEGGEPAAQTGSFASVLHQEVRVARLQLLFLLVLTSVLTSRIQAQTEWVVDTSATDPMEDRAAVRAYMYSVEGTRLLLTLSCTIDGFVAVFVEGEQPASPSAPSATPGAFLTSIRLRFDKSPPIAGQALVSYAVPTRMAFASLSGTKMITARRIGARLQAAATMWIEYSTIDGLRTAKFQIPTNSTAVVNHVFRSCGETPPAPPS